MNWQYELNANKQYNYARAGDTDTFQSHGEFMNVKNTIWCSTATLSAAGTATVQSIHSQNHISNRFDGAKLSVPYTRTKCTLNSYLEEQNGR